LGGLGLPFAILGGIFLLIVAREKRQLAKLDRVGKTIIADFLHTYRDTRISRNGEHPYRVVAQSRNTISGAITRFESEPLWVDPGDSLKQSKLKVIVDPEDTSNHRVDISALIGAAHCPSR
jgi:hypothetical protein